ncbi:uncharacterized protein DSM5745_03234 [Aspergillus mulundensis]|uniref:Uncharacterized protein n=1 Tax=Aspergillus mulundensis TaxID=1810919 RepID=A0A3D8SK04_9EURO|nr:hypothetical protein DSM5745_03234 [Aspergillus mulundensis]RDW86592.1 hypothetical protein DSM5745_03234 [Aspergillus mulundensis]
MSNECAGAIPAAYAAQIFDEAKVPYVLWGHWAVAMFGRNKAFPDVDFIIADAEPNAATKPLDTAIAALSAKGIHRCTDASCQEWTSDRAPPVTAPVNVKDPIDWEEVGQNLADNRLHAVGDAHFHLESTYTYFTVLTLYSQTRILWWMPRLSLQPVTPTDPNFMLTNDVRLFPPGPRGPTGPWTELYPVRILRINKLAEAIILLRIRDGHRGDVNRCWERMWLNLLGDTPADGQLTPQMLKLREEINPRYRIIVDQFCGLPTGRTARIGLIWKEFRDEMLETGEMGRMPSLHPKDVIQRMGKYLP